MLKWLIWLLAGLAFVSFAVGFLLIFTIFWIFIGLPLIITGLIILVVAFLLSKKKKVFVWTNQAKRK